jgi:hypothetical protein
VGRFEVACGSGIKRLALARQRPGVRVTHQEWPEVPEAAVEVATKLGLTGQVATLRGDLQHVLTV